MSKHLRGVKPALGRDAEALTKAPPAPAYLSAHAKAEWRRVLPLLVARGVITKADLAGVGSIVSPLVLPGRSVRRWRWPVACPICGWAVCKSATCRPPGSLPPNMA